MSSGGMRVLLIGALSGELAKAARMAIARGAKLEQVDGIEPAMARLRQDARVDIVLCEISHDIGALVRALSAERMAVGVVACGMDADAPAAVRAIRDGAREFLPLPPDPDLIAAILEAASGDSHTMIARDPVMLACLRRAEQVAGAEASVLITGESGTGKEVLARHIHRKSRRANGPFVALNCAAIPENLLESEMFGHEKGAFSGAAARRIGKFEAADGGTILLDEISEMDIRLQAKLLRAIQEREIDRVGGSGPVKVNVRILATSNRDMLADCTAGRFREDLYFRLNVVSLRIPALRERPGDIGPLADHYARHYAEVNGLAARPIASSAHARLTGAWLARECSGTGEYDPSCRPALDRGGGGHGGIGRHRWANPAPACRKRAQYRQRIRRRGRLGWPHHGRRGAGPDPTHADAYAWVTAPMRPPSSGFRSARCATSCGITARRGWKSHPQAWRRSGYPVPTSLRLGAGLDARAVPGPFEEILPRHGRRAGLRHGDAACRARYPAADDAAGYGPGDFHHRLGPGAHGGAVLEAPAGFHLVSHPSAAHHAAASVAERGDHAADPQPRQRGARWPLAMWLRRSAGS